MFLRNVWYVAAWSSEVGRTMLSRRILNEPVVLFRSTAGAPVALEDRCVHRFLPLSLGELDGDEVVCGYHGMTFDASGKCIRIPGQTMIPSTACVRRYPVAEKWGCVWIWMGDPTQARESDIVNIPHYSDPAWGINRGEPLHIRANYQLITDNLLDPTHVSFVHKSTFGTASVAEHPVNTEHDDNSVRVSRHVPSSPAAPFFAKIGGFKGNVDRWQIYSLTLPALAMVDSGCRPCEGTTSTTASAEDGSVRINSYNFITPETETSSFYFYFQLRNFAPLDLDMTVLMNEQFSHAFHEDKVVLEAIQAATDPTGYNPKFHLAIDNASIRARRMLARKIQQEATPPLVAAQTSPA